MTTSVYQNYMKCYNTQKTSKTRFSNLADLKLKKGTMQIAFSDFVYNIIQRNEILYMVSQKRERFYFFYPSLSLHTLIDDVVLMAVKDHIFFVYIIAY